MAENNLGQIHQDVYTTLVVGDATSAGSKSGSDSKSKRTTSNVRSQLDVTIQSRLTISRLGLLGPMSVLRPLLPVASPQANGRCRAGCRRLGNTPSNGRFRQQRRTAPDPYRMAKQNTSRVGLSAEAVGGVLNKSGLLCAEHGSFD